MCELVSHESLTHGSARAGGCNSPRATHRLGTDRLRGLWRPQYWWGLFAVGGMVAAVLVPVHILFQGILGPLGLAPYLAGSFAAMSRVVGNPIGKLYVLMLVG